MNSLQTYQGHQEVLAAVDYRRSDFSDAAPRIGRYVLLGFLCLSFFVGGAAYWAYKARLDGAVFAEASLVVDGNRKAVQHLDGGIVRAIRVADGDAVEAGQTLISLDSGEIDVTVDVLSSQVGELAIRRARLLAQIAQSSQFDLSSVAALSETMHQRHWYPAFLTQKDLFDTELRARRAEEEILDQRIESLMQEISGLQDQRDSNRRQSEISQTELAGLEELFRKGLVTGNRVSAINVEIERLRGVDASLKTAQARAQNEIGQLELTGISQKRLRAEAITTELAGIEARLAELGPQLSGATERLARVEIKAPVSGPLELLKLCAMGRINRDADAGTN